MIRVRFYCRSDGSAHLRMRGHAKNSAVCAAASALGDTAAAAAEYLFREGLLARSPWIERERGSLILAVTPKPCTQGEALMVLWTVQAGLSALAKEYPQWVRLESVLHWVDKEMQT